MAFVSALPLRLSSSPSSTLSISRSKPSLLRRRPPPPRPTLTATATTAAPSEPSPAPNSPSGVSPRAILASVMRLAKPLYAGRRRNVAIAWTLLVLFLAFGTTLYAVGMSTVLRKFWNTLSARDPEKFSSLLRLYGVIVVVGPFLLAGFDWAKGRLALIWRQALTEKLLGGFFADGGSTAAPYYRIVMGRAVDNSDQRLTDDVRLFTERAVRFLCVFGVAVFDLSVFSVVLFKILPPLFFTLIVYSVLGSVGVALYGRGLVGTNTRQLKLEADYRFSLLRVRDNAESIAFYRGGASEKEESLRRFRDVFSNSIRLLGLSRNVAFFSNSYRYWIQVLPSIVLAKPYFDGKIVIGTFSQTLFSFNHVLSSMGLFVAEFVALSEFGAGIRRLEKLSDEIDVAAAEAIAAGIGTNPGIELLPTPADAPAALTVKNLCLQTPASTAYQSLVQNLDLSISAGQRLLIKGQSGIGKTSLLRSLAGLWSAGSGSITPPDAAQTLFLPQRPFLSLNSLRDNVVYPLSGEAAAAVTDDEVLAALVRVNLPHVVQRMGGLDADGERIGQTLSVGEQQRLAFARVITTKPQFVLLDESTSALDEENERLMYDIVREMKATVVSVGNRSSLPEFHDTCLTLKTGGAWNVAAL